MIDPNYQKNHLSIERYDIKYWCTFRGAYQEQRFYRGNFIRSNSNVKPSLDRSDNKSIASQPRKVFAPSHFASAEKGSSKYTKTNIIVKNIKHLEMGKKKSSFTELPAIERTEAIYKNSNFQLK